MRDSRNLKTWFRFVSEPIPSPSSCKPYPTPHQTNKTPRTLLGELVTAYVFTNLPSVKQTILFLKKEAQLLNKSSPWKIPSLTVHFHNYCIHMSLLKELCSGMEKKWKKIEGKTQYSLVWRNRCLGVGDGDKNKCPVTATPPAIDIFPFYKNNILRP